MYKPNVKWIWFKVNQKVNKYGYLEPRIIWKSKFRFHQHKCPSSEFIGKLTNRISLTEKKQPQSTPTGENRRKGSKITMAVLTFKHYNLFETYLKPVGWLKNVVSSQAAVIFGFKFSPSWIRKWLVEGFWLLHMWTTSHMCESNMTLGLFLQKFVCGATELLYNTPPRYGFVGLGTLQICTYYVSQTFAQPSSGSASLNISRSTLT